MPACTTPQAKAKPTPLISHLELLLVEHEPLLRMATAAMLADLGHGVLEAGTGAEALSRLIHGVDVMICGLEPLDIEGPALVDQIRKRLPGLPVIMAYETHPNDGHGIVSLSKPYGKAALQAALLQAATACARAA